MDQEMKKPAAEETASRKKPVRKHRWYFYVGIVLLVLVILAGGFLGYMTVTEYRPQQQEPAEVGGSESGVPYGGEPLRILTFNTGYGGLGRESDFLMDGGKGTGAEDEETVRKNIQGIRNILKKADADIYMLQEVDKHSGRTFYINELEEYEAELPEYSRYYAPNYICNFVPYPLQDPIGRVYSGVATYSRFQVTSAVRESLPVPFSWPIRTANLKRCLLVSRIPIEGSDKELVIINLHLEAYDDGEGKIAQTRQLIDTLEAEYAKGNYVIAGGDFNQIFPDADNIVKDSSYWVPGRLETLPEEWRYEYDHVSPTCRLLNQPLDPEDPLTQYYTIDGFILSPNIEVSHIETMDEHFEFSDHNPVVMDVVLK